MLPSPPMLKKIILVVFSLNRAFLCRLLLKCIHLQYVKSIHAIKEFIYHGLNDIVEQFLSRQLIGITSMNCHDTALVIQ